MMPTRQPIRKSAVIGRGLGSPIWAKRSPGDGQRCANRDAQVAGVILRELFRLLRGFKNSTRDQGMDQ